MESDMSSIETLLNGFRKFRELYYEKSPGLYRDLIHHGQNPRFAVVACSDSRVDPAIVLQTEPGDIFAVRNVAALVPPFEQDGLYHGTSAALEFAVRGLHVEHIIIIGHAHCGGVDSMIQQQEGGEDLGMFIGAWTSLLREARERALADSPGLEGNALLAASERHAVRLSLENLTTFPFVREAVAAGKLSLQGWYLNIFDGALEIWDPESATFSQVS
ncbi:MAG: carbonic anhydrase [Rhodospirillaceae bacterium]|jgi:carbonic anhydrase|nr:carbonic anhydrase [Rhodospirillaceae bacterium]MBT4427906.1 carbonic anhydrase [Rhodospirillaceae bacterium]MBT5780247.1 carbonic anhydrase [Rhodospirillaceae bacterium]MBT7292163.1 carbonic anhydrase [Rhodospirillaceae bacterium]